MPSQELREVARELFRKALQAADAYGATVRALRRDGPAFLVAGRRIELGKSSRIHVVGAGKASAPMAAAVEDVLGDLVADGVVVAKEGHSVPLRRIAVREAGHPVPDQRGLRATEEVLRVIDASSPHDVILCLLSGGASALLVKPVSGLPLEEKQRLTQLLLACGASIEEINCVRKHLSAVKGGRLAQRAAPRQVISLIVSDVIGDRLDTIASGPTAPDPTTFDEALGVIGKYGLESKLEGLSVLEVLRKGAAGKRPETPKPSEPFFRRVSNVIVASNRLALEAAASHARELGFRTLVLTSCLRGEAKEAGKFIASIAWEVWQSGSPVEPPACLLFGGETTVRLGEAPGKGGRNQELALSACLELPPSEKVVLLCAGTDGTDGPTDAAGAMVDGKIAERARRAGLEPLAYLEAHDSYSFFERTGELLRTGPTGTNVMDLAILLVGGRHEADKDCVHDRSRH
jgi:hydroxypyruvate reductase